MLCRESVLGVVNTKDCVGEEQQKRSKFTMSHNFALITYTPVKLHSFEADNLLLRSYSAAYS